MWDEYCRKFRGGVCEKIKEQYGKPLCVPRQWCIHVCRGSWDGKALNPEGYVPPSPELTVEKMIADYEQAKAKMQKLGRAGELVSQNEYIRRRTICKECNGGFKCLHTCCGLPTKTAQSIWKCKSNKW